jgi:hypothetical protein
MTQPVSGSGLIHGLSIESTSSRVTLDFKNIFTEISYYESLNSPSTSMSISVADAVSLKSSLPIIGGETVRFSFSDSEPESNRISGRMQVYKLSGLNRIQQSVDTYDLFLTTPEMLRDSYEIVESSYKNKNIDSMLNEIFQSYIQKISNKKIVTVEPTDGLYTTTFARISPFTALTHLADEAKSKNGRSSSNYFFFETSKGYTFASFQYLMRQPVKKVYYYLQDRIPGDAQFDRNRITALEEPVGFDLISGVVEGQFATQVLTLDPVAKRFRRSDYLYNRDFSSIERSNQYPRLAPETSQRFGSSPSREKFIVSNSYRGSIPFVSENESDTQNVFRRRQDFLARETSLNGELFSNVTKILVHGDSSLSAGDTIYIQIPKGGESSITERQMDGFTGGKYLITALCHRFSPGATTYVTAIECVKDAYSQPVDGRQ